MTLTEFLKAFFGVLLILIFMVVIWFGSQVACDLMVGKDVCYEIGEAD